MILVVEDEPGIRTLLKNALERAGFAVATAADGKEALIMLAGGLQPSAVLTDFMMPQLEGNEFLEELNKLTNAAILVYSGYVNCIRDEVKKKLTAVYAKPTALDTLVDQIKAIILTPKK